MPIRVLVVDDDADVRELTRAVIEHAEPDLEVVADAAGGEEALALVEETDPEVIVLDVMMPGMNGFECASRLREERPEQLIVFFSAYSDEHIDALARALGAGAVVPKTSIARLPEIIESVALA